ncbi:unnamed protein product [Symbiodinium natans]|uniref:Uncharacterized protein n=1 Tax=Symbiodinium natans TaxID=878477 RepID=A0A812MJR3_9DINO|nr:unnamed protein product [Symbiodinium natans]
MPRQAPLARRCGAGAATGPSSIRGLCFGLGLTLLASLLCRRGSVLDFVGQACQGEARQPSLCARHIRATGKTRLAPDAALELDSVWRIDPKDFKTGWDSEQGKWIDLPKNMIKKWWRQPSYLTPYGYRYPPMWSKKDYALACTEMKLSKIEANMIKDLKDRGMTIEEIRGRASAFEFIEHSKLPKLTPKLTFLMQVKALWEGKDPAESELIDMADVYKADTGKDLDAED